MTRRRIATTSSLSGAVAYQVWVADELHSTIRGAVVKSDLSWPEWAEKAMARFEEESHDEQEILIHAWKRGRQGKKQLSFRVNSGTLDRAKSIAERHEGTVQAVFAHAFFMAALAQSYQKAVQV